MTIAEIAEKAYSVASKHGQTTGLPWASLTDNEQDALEKVANDVYAVESPQTVMRGQGLYVVEMKADGWAYGRNREDGAKVSPLVIEYASLSPLEQERAGIFRSVCVELFSELEGD